MIAVRGKDGTTLASNFPPVGTGVELTHVHSEPAYLDRQDYRQIDPYWNPRGHNKAAESLAEFFAYSSLTTQQARRGRPGPSTRYVRKTRKFWRAGI